MVSFSFPFLSDYRLITRADKPCVKKCSIQNVGRIGTGHRFGPCCLPDVERDGHDGVEDDGVGEEDEQRNDGRAAQRVVGNLPRPRQVDLELR